MMDTYQGRATEEMLEMLGIGDDLTPEEGAEIGRENAVWALMEATGKTAEEVREVLSDIIEKILHAKGRG